MLELIDSASDVVAARIAHRITGADLDAVMDRLEDAMAAHRTVHVFVETQDIDGIDVAGLPSYAARATPLFGKLDCFGRVAVVADQAWIRAGSRIESALLPSMRYRVFRPDERDAAFDWVSGARAD